MERIEIPIVTDKVLMSNDNIKTYFKMNGNYYGVALTDEGDYVPIYVDQTTEENIVMTKGNDKKETDFVDFSLLLNKHKTSLDALDTMLDRFFTVVDAIRISKEQEVQEKLEVLVEDVVEEVLDEPFSEVVSLEVNELAELVEEIDFIEIDEVLLDEPEEELLVQEELEVSLLDVDKNKGVEDILELTRELSMELEQAKEILEQQSSNTQVISPAILNSVVDAKLVEEEQPIDLLEEKEEILLDLVPRLDETGKQIESTAAFVDAVILALVTGFIISVTILSMFLAF